jgi:hypothetical protein
MRDPIQSDSEAAHRRPDSRLHGRPRASYRKRLVIAVATVLGLAALLMAAGSWLGIRANLIGDELQAASRLIPQLKSQVSRNDAQGAANTVAIMKGHATKAHEATADPLWSIAGSLPWVGVNFQAATEVAASAEEVTDRGIGPLVSVLKSLDWGAMAPDGGTVDLRNLAQSRPTLLSAATAVRQSSDRLNGINADVLLPQLSEPLLESRAQLTSLSESLDRAADIAAIAPTMMGNTAPRSYLLLVQNNSESRATGGIPGALAVLKVDKGKLSLGSQTSATAMGSFNPVVAVDPEQTQIFSGRLGKFMQDVNLTPDFPTAAQTAQKMWLEETGQRLDGVLSIDPIALSYVLGVTGPVEVTDSRLQEVAGQLMPTTLTAKNVVPTLLSDVYTKITDPLLQDEYFAGVAKEVFSKLSVGGGKPLSLVNAITRGAQERRVLLWSAQSDEQAVISRYPLSGAVIGPSISPAQFGVYFNDGTGAKMDYHVKRTVQLIEECPANGYSEVKVRITSTNTAPKDAATSLPEYVTGGGAFGVPAGSVQTNIIAYGPVQSNVETAFLAGKKTGFAAHRHGGRPVGSVTIRLAPGESSTVDFTFGKIVQHTEPRLSVTPTVQALKDVVLDTIPAKCMPAA